MPKPERTLTLPEIKTEYGVGKYAVRRAIKAGKLVPVNRPERGLPFRVALSEVERWRRQQLGWPDDRPLPPPKR